MTYLFSQNRFTLAERRLVRMAGGPDVKAPIEALKTEGGEKVKDAINPTVEAQLEAAKRLEAVGKNEAKNLDAFKKVADAKFAAEKAKTPPATDEAALKAVQDLLKKDFPFVKVEMDGPGKIKVLYEKPAEATALDRVKTDPRYTEIKDLYDAIDPPFQKAFEEALALLDTTPDLGDKLTNFAKEFAGLGTDQQKEVLKSIFDGTEPKDPDAKKVHDLVKTGPVQEFFKGVIKAFTSIEFNENNAETLEKAKSILEAARKGYKVAKTQEDQDYIRETTLGRLQMMGVNVAADEALLTAEPIPKLEMLQTTEKWEAILNKVMGFARMAGAIMAKFDRIKNGSKGTSSSPAEAGDKEKKEPKYTVETKKEAPDKNTLTFTLENIPMDKAIAKVKTVAATIKASDVGGKLVVSEVKDADTTKVTDAMNALVGELKNVTTAPAFSPEQKNTIRAKTDTEYNKVVATINGAGGPSALKLSDLDSVIAAINTEKTIPDPAAGSPDVATHAARVADIDQKLFEMKSLQKYIDVHGFFKQNAALATERQAIYNEKNSAKLKDVARRIITMNELELNALKTKIDGKDLANTDLTKKFIGGSDLDARIKAIEAALPLYRTEAVATPNKFETAEQNKAKRKEVGSALFANSATLGVSGLTEDDWIGDDIQKLGDGRWAIDIDGRSGGQDWLQVGFDDAGSHWKVGLTSGKNDTFSWMPLEGDFTNASIANPEGRRQANEIVAKLRKVEADHPIDPTKVP